MDNWKLFADFIVQMGKDVEENYDENDAWPVILDEFVQMLWERHEEN